jgi:hypothetical protein
VSNNKKNNFNLARNNPHAHCHNPKSTSQQPDPSQYRPHLNHCRWQQQEQGWVKGCWQNHLQPAWQQQGQVKGLGWVKGCWKNRL